MNVEQELKGTRHKLLTTFAENIKAAEVTEDELNEIREKLVNEPQHVIDKAFERMNLYKKLQVILKDKSLIDQIDQALEYIELVKQYNSAHDA